MGYVGNSLFPASAILSLKVTGGALPTVTPRTGGRGTEVGGHWLGTLQHPHSAQGL